MTSNTGSHLIQENFEKLDRYTPDEIIETTKREVMDLLKKSMRPEFLNRIDEIIMFRPLSRKEVKAIVRIQLQHLADTLLHQGFSLHATGEAEQVLMEKGFDPQFGARPVKRVIQKEVLNELSKQLLAGKISREHIIVLDAIDGHIVFRKPIKAEEEVALS